MRQHLHVPSGAWFQPRRVRHERREDDAAGVHGLRPRVRAGALSQPGGRLGAARGAVSGGRHEPLCRARGHQSHRPRNGPQARGRALQAGKDQSGQFRARLGQEMGAARGAREPAEQPRARPPTHARRKGDGRSRRQAKQRDDARGSEAVRGRGAPRGRRQPRSRSS